MNEKIKKLIEKGVIFHKIDKYIEDSYYQDRIKGYSFSIRKNEAENFKKGMIVIIEINQYSKKEYILHTVKNKSKATSNERKISLSTDFYKLNIDFLKIINSLNRQQINLFNQKYEQKESFVLSRKLSVDLFEILLLEDPKIDDYISNILFKSFSTKIIEEAKKNILSFADFHNSSLGEEITLEDNAILGEIGKFLPEQQSDEFGCFSYKNDDAELFIVIANRNKIEDYFGVDLVFINDIDKNLIMLQYKMLKKEDDHWVCRDQTLNEQVKKMQDTMRIINISESEKESIYRLNSDPFFIRFLKNRNTDEGFNSYIIPLKLYEILKNQGKFKGVQGGFCIKDTVLMRKSLGISDLSNLVKNGYLGTYPTVYDSLFKIISLLSKRIEDHPLVLGYKKKLGANKIEGTI